MTYLNRFVNITISISGQQSHGSRKRGVIRWKYFSAPLSPRSNGRGRSETPIPSADSRLALDSWKFIGSAMIKTIARFPEF